MIDSRKVISAAAGNAAIALGLDVVESSYKEKAGNEDKPDIVEVYIKLKGERKDFITAVDKNGEHIVESYIAELVHSKSDKVDSPDFKHNWRKELGSFISVE